MSALKEVKRPSAPVPYASDPDESGIRRVPTADDLPDFTEELRELSDAPPKRRTSAPPPIPAAALWRKAEPGRKSAKLDKARLAPPAPAVEDEDYDDDGISLVDFDLVAKSCPPKLAGYARNSDAYPSVPGIPAYFYISTPPPAPKRPFDYELALHIAVVWLGALAGGLLALL